MECDYESNFYRLKFVLILFYFIFFYLFISFFPLLYAKIKDQRRIIF